MKLKSIEFSSVQCLKKNQLDGETQSMQVRIAGNPKADLCDTVPWNSARELQVFKSPENAAVRNNSYSNYTQAFSSLVHSPSDFLHLSPRFLLTFCCLFYSQVPPFCIPYCPFSDPLNTFLPPFWSHIVTYKKSENGWLSSLKETENFSESALRGLTQIKHIINPK